MSDLDSKITGWKSIIDSVSDKVRDQFKDVPDEDLNSWREEGKWSVAQHLDHLIIINSSYYSVIEQAREGSLQPPWHARVGFLVRFFGRVILKSVLPDTKRKTKTLPVWEPSENVVPDGIVERFLKHQDEFKNFIDANRVLLEENIVIPSPANASIQYYFQTALDIITQHELRHWEHMRECVNA